MHFVARRDVRHLTFASGSRASRRPSQTGPNGPRPQQHRVDSRRRARIERPRPEPMGALRAIIGSSSRSCRLESALSAAAGLIAFWRPRGPFLCRLRQSCRPTATPDVLRDKAVPRTASGSAQQHIFFKPLLATAGRPTNRPTRTPQQRRTRARETTSSSPPSTLSPFRRRFPSHAGSFRKCPNIWSSISCWCAGEFLIF